MMVIIRKGTFNCKGLKTGSVLSLDTTSKLLDFQYDVKKSKLKSMMN